MNKRLDTILKIVITIVIIITLISIALPVLKSSGILPGKNEEGPGAGRPDGAMPGPGRESSDKTTAQAVNFYTAAVGTVSNYIKVNGDIVTDVEIEIYPDIEGKIIDISKSVGSHVNKNEVIAKVDPSLPGQKYAASSVYSTISGTVLSINADTGDKVSTSTSIITVGDLEDLKLLTYIPEKYIGNLSLGLPAEVSFAAYPGTVYYARITELSPVVDATSRTIEVTLDFTDENNKVKAGMFASIKLVTEQVKNVITVPASAITEYYGKNSVLIINDDNTVTRRTINVGLETIEMVEITSGLSEGERVVTQGQSLLKEGSLVKLVE